MSSAQEIKSEPMSQPDYFKGVGGSAPVIDTIEFVESGTVLDSKDTFLTFKLKHLRTGILKNDLAFTPGGGFIFNDKETVPAGTKMYAANFSYASDLQTYRSAGGLGWCAVRVDEDEPLCIFSLKSRLLILKGTSLSK